MVKETELPSVSVSIRSAGTVKPRSRGPLSSDTKAPPHTRQDSSGTGTPFPWGGLDDDFGKYANLADRTRRFIYSKWDAAACVQTRRPYRPEQNYPLHEERWEDDWFTLNFTGRALPNRWGLYDMHGNAAEWTATTTNGFAVARGGSFASRPKDATSSFKLYYLPWQKVYDVGFRVLLEE